MVCAAGGSVPIRHFLPRMLREIKEMAKTKSSRVQWVKAHRDPGVLTHSGNCQADRAAKLGAISAISRPDFGHLAILEAPDGDQWPHSVRRLGQWLRNRDYRKDQNVVGKPSTKERRFNRSRRKTSVLQLLAAQKSVFLHDTCYCGWPDKDSQRTGRDVVDLRELHPVLCPKADWTIRSPDKTLSGLDWWWDLIASKWPVGFWKLGNSTPWGGLQDQSLWQEITRGSQVTMNLCTNFIYTPDGNCMKHEFFPRADGDIEATSAAAEWIHQMELDPVTVNATVQGGPIFVLRADLSKEIPRSKLLRLPVFTSRPATGKFSKFRGGTDLIRRLHLVRGVLTLTSLLQTVFLDSSLPGRPGDGLLLKPTPAWLWREAAEAAFLQHGVSVLWGDTQHNSLPHVGTPKERSEILKRYSHAAVSLELANEERDKRSQNDMVQVWEDSDQEVEV